MLEQEQRGQSACNRVRQDERKVTLRIHKSVSSLVFMVVKVKVAQSGMTLRPMGYKPTKFFGPEYSSG